MLACKAAFTVCSARTGGQSALFHGCKQHQRRLENQPLKFIKEHNDTKLIIIDTLQKVCDESKETYSYANNYQIIARLKQFAEAYGICLMLVRHTCKQQADDKFDMISGTN